MTTLTPGGQKLATVDEAAQAESFGRSCVGKPSDRQTIEDTESHALEPTATGDGLREAAQATSDLFDARGSLFCSGEHQLEVVQRLRAALARPAPEGQAAAGVGETLGGRLRWFLQQFRQSEFGDCPEAAAEYAPGARITPGCWFDTESAELLAALQPYQTRATVEARGITYQYREIGEGEGWRDCSKATYDGYSSDPHIDTRKIPAALTSASQPPEAASRAAITPAVSADDAGEDEPTCYMCLKPIGSEPFHTHPEEGDIHEACCGSDTPPGRVRPQPPEAAAPSGSVGEAVTGKWKCRACGVESDEPDSAVIRHPSGYGYRAPCCGPCGHYFSAEEIAAHDPALATQQPAPKAPVADAVGDQLLLIQSAESSADWFTKRLKDPMWRPNRADAEAGRNAITTAVRAARRLAALTPPQTARAGDGVERVRHVKRGTEYEVLGEAEAQITTQDYQSAKVCGIGCRILREGDRVTVYRDPTSGKLWCRFTDEFRDGRFVTLAAPAQADTGESA